MAVYITPRALARDLLICIICFRRVSGTEVTTGSISQDGSQAFACSQHLRNREAWITAWALFEAQASLTQKAKAAGRSGRAA